MLSWLKRQRNRYQTGQIVLHCRKCGWTGKARSANGSVSWGLKYLCCPRCRCSPMDDTRLTTGDSMLKKKGDSDVSTTTNPRST